EGLVAVYGETLLTRLEQQVLHIDPGLAFPLRRDVPTAAVARQAVLHRGRGLEQIDDHLRLQRWVIGRSVVTPEAGPSADRASAPSTLAGSGFGRRRRRGSAR